MKYVIKYDIYSPFKKKLTVNFSMILIAPCICKPSNVMKDDSVCKRNIE